MENEMPDKASFLYGRKNYFDGESVYKSQFIHYFLKNKSRSVDRLFISFINMFQKHWANKFSNFLSKFFFCFCQIKFINS